MDAPIFYIIIFLWLKWIYCTTVCMAHRDSCNRFHLLPPAVLEKLTITSAIEACFYMEFICACVGESKLINARAVRRKKVIKYGPRAGDNNTCTYNYTCIIIRHHTLDYNNYYNESLRAN